MTVPTQPPFYLKHLEKGKWIVDGPFTSEGAFQSAVLRNEWDAHNVKYEVIDREEADKLRNVPEPEVEAKRGPGRPKKSETPLSEPDETTG